MRGNTSKHTVGVGFADTLLAMLYCTVDQYTRFCSVRLQDTYRAGRAQQDLYWEGADIHKAPGC